MKLRDLITQFVAFRKTLGERCAHESILRSFSRKLGEKTDIRAIPAKSVRSFLDGTGPLTRYWHLKHRALLSFFRYALSRGHVRSIPLPSVVPKQPPGLKPYIYSREELRRLLKGTAACLPSSCMIEPRTLHMIVLLLYGAGLRASEALALNLADVDLTRAVVTVRLSKFFKSRLVPLGVCLTRALTAYCKWRRSAHPPAGNDSPFFVGRTGQRVFRGTLLPTFRRLRSHTGIRRTDKARYQPRLHDLRHSFAVHRLITWYRQGADVQKLLPHLSTYMGHTSLYGTQVYLSMTPELLTEANSRFERYAGEEGDHA